MCFLFKQKTAYEMRISDWSTDVCSSDLVGGQHLGDEAEGVGPLVHGGDDRQQGALGEQAVADLAALRAADAARLAVGVGRHVVVVHVRSEERRVGKECVSTCRAGWSQYH